MIVLPPPPTYQDHHVQMKWFQIIGMFPVHFEDDGRLYADDQQPK